MADWLYFFCTVDLYDHISIERLHIEIDLLDLEQCHIIIEAHEPR